jgi:hypothetical protein
MSYDLSLKDFVGKHINAAYVESGNDGVMYWLVNGEWYKLDAVGDCCSHSWYAHCDSGDVLQNATLLDFEDFSKESIHENWNLIRINMLKFKTDKGYCTIEFRNSSNGYYSGWCSIIKEAPSNKDNLKELGDW